MQRACLGVGLLMLLSGCANIQQPVKHHAAKHYAPVSKPVVVKPTAPAPAVPEKKTLKKRGEHALRWFLREPAAK